MTAATTTQGTASAATARSATDARTAFLLWIGFSILLFYALVVGGGWLGMYAGVVRVVNLAVIAVGLTAWLIVAWRRPEWRPRTAIWPALAAPLVAFTLSTLASDYQRLGLEFMAYAVLLVALYLLLVRIMALPYVRARIGGLMAILALVLGTAYVAWSVALWVEWWGLVGELRLPPFRPTHLGMTWGSPSVVFTVQVLLTTAAVGGLGYATRGARVAVGLLVVLLAAVAIISGSRSGWLSIVGTIVVIGAIALLFARGRDRLMRLWRARPLRIALVPVVLAVALVAVLFGPAMIDRFGAYGDGERPTYWATAVRMFADAPLLGQGPGTWMVRRVAYTEAGEPDLYQPHAHNQYLQTGAELGLVGLAAGAVALLVVGWLLLGALRGDDPWRRRWAWASLFGLVFLGLNVVVDVHTIPTVALLVGIPIAALDASSKRRVGLPSGLSSLQRPLYGLGIVALVIGSALALGYLARLEQVAMTHGRALTLAAEGDWDAALEPALDAATADPDIGVFQLTAAQALAATGEWERAASAYRRAVEIDDLPAAWLGLASAQAEMGRPGADVAASLEEALRLGRQQIALAFAAGRVYERVGATDDADELFAHVLALEPSLASDAGWRAELGEERFGSIVEAAMTADPAGAWELALMAGDGERARELVADRADGPLLLDVIAAWEGSPEALATVQAAADAAPQDGTRLATAARVSEHAGAAEAADRYRRLMRLGPHYGPATWLAAVGTRDPLADAPVGTSTYYYGTYTYRRASPLDVLPPGVSGLVMTERADEQDR